MRILDNIYGFLHYFVNHQTVEWFGINQTADTAQKYAATNLDALNSKYSDFGGMVVGKDFYFT